MIKHDLNEYIYLQRERKMLEDEIRKLDLNVDDGILRRIHASQEDRHRFRNHYQKQLQMVTGKLDAADRYIASVDDPLLKEIIQRRCLKGQEWDVISGFMGVGTSYSLRMYYKRKLEGVEE